MSMFQPLRGLCARGRKTWHIRKSGMRTLCGKDSSEWMDMGYVEIDNYLCSVCNKLRGSI